jgi:nucleotide-binding universal stress UspA family protein
MRCTVAATRSPSITRRTLLLVGDPVGSVISAADEQQADLVVIGKTGHGVGGLVSGGTAMKLAHRTKRPLLLIPDTPVAVGSNTP